MCRVVLYSCRDPVGTVNRGESASEGREREAIHPKGRRRISSPRQTWVPVRNDDGERGGRCAESARESTS
jgi:hypothetical protein